MVKKKIQNTKFTVRRGLPKIKKKIIRTLNLPIRTKFLPKKVCLVP
jgi:hypothetical protein